MVYFADIAAAKNTATKPSRGDKLGAGRQQSTIKRRRNNTTQSISQMKAGRLINNKLPRGDATTQK
jgi:hypothetical protein